MSGRGRGPHSDARSNPWHGGGRGRGRGTSGAVASTPTQTPAYFPPPSVSASSSSAPVTSLSSEMEQKLTLDATPVAVVASESKPGPPPASSKVVRFQQRPGFGTIGRKIQVKANHFLVQVSDRDLHHYDVSFFFPLNLFYCSKFSLAARVPLIWLSYFILFLIKKQKLHLFICIFILRVR